MTLDDVHDGVVRLTVRPVPLPLEHYGQRRDRLRAGLDHPLHGIVVCELADVAAAVLDYVDVVTVLHGLHGGQRDAGLGPQAGQHDLLPPRLLDGGDESLVVPGVHRRALDDGVGREHGLHLRPEVPAEGFGLDGAEDHRDVEHARGLRERDDVVDDRLAVEVRYAE